MKYQISIKTDIQNSNVEEETPKEDSNDEEPPGPATKRRRAQNGQTEPQDDKLSTKKVSKRNGRPKKMSSDVQEDVSLNDEASFWTLF